MKRVVVVMSVIAVALLLAPGAGAKHGKKFHSTIGTFKAQSSGGKWRTLSGEIRSTKAACVHKPRAVTIRPFLNGPVAHTETKRDGTFRVHLRRPPYWRANQAFDVKVASVSIRDGVCLEVRASVAPDGQSPT